MAHRLDGSGGHRFVEDVVRANLSALKPGVRGIYNVGTGIETNVVQIFQGLAQGAGVTSPPQHGPAKAGEQKRSVISAAKIGRELGWKPQIPLAEGLKRTLEYFRSR